MTESSFVEQSKVQFKEGAVVYQKGEMAAEMFIVMSGRVRLYLADGAAGAWSEEFAKGDFFGECSLLEALPREATAVAVEETELVSVSRGTFMRMIRQNPEVAVKIMQGLAKKNRELTAKIELEAKTAAKPEPAPQPAPEKKRACFVSITSGQKYPIESEGALIGRSDPSMGFCPDIDLTYDDGHQTVSRQHAYIAAKFGRYFIKEEDGAASGTFAHGTRLSPEEVREIFNGDRIGFGAVVLTFQLLDE